MKKKKVKSKGAGGARKGAGRPKSGVETDTIHIRVPVDKKQSVKELVRKFLKGEENVKEEPFIEMGTAMPVKNGKAVIVTDLNVKTPKTNYSIKTTGNKSTGTSDYLERRRKLKQ